MKFLIAYQCSPGSQQPTLETKEIQVSKAPDSKYIEWLQEVLAEQIQDRDPSVPTQVKIFAWSPLSE